MNVFSKFWIRKCSGWKIKQQPSPPQWWFYDGLLIIFSYFQRDFFVLFSWLHRNEVVNSHGNFILALYSTEQLREITVAKISRHTFDWSAYYIYELKKCGNSKKKNYSFYISFILLWCVFFFILKSIKIAINSFILQQCGIFKCYSKVQVIRFGLKMKWSILKYV